MTSSRSATGSCLCGAVRFTAALPSQFCAHCHCSMCRRNHGAGYVTMTEPIDRAPQFHVFFDSRAAWVTPGDDLPRRGGKTGFKPLPGEKKPRNAER